MIIYRGWGVLALLIPTFCILVGTFFFGVQGNTSLDVFLYSLLASAPIVFILGKWLNRKSIHDLYYIRLHYWGLAWGLVAIAILLFRHI